MRRKLTFSIPVVVFYIYAEYTALQFLIDLQLPSAKYLVGIYETKRNLIRIVIENNNGQYKKPFKTAISNFMSLYPDRVITFHELKSYMLKFDRDVAVFENGTLRWNYK